MSPPASYLVLVVIWVSFAAVANAQLASYAAHLAQSFTDTLTYQSTAKLPASGVDLLQVAISLGPCAVRHMHYHFNADEMVLVTSGVMGYVVINNTNHWVSEEVGAGAVVMLPKGGLHLVYNPTCGRTNVTNIFTSAYPVTYVVNYALESTLSDPAVFDFIQDSTYPPGKAPELRSKDTRLQFTYSKKCLKTCGTPYNSTALFGA